MRPEYATARRNAAYRTRKIFPEHLPRIQAQREAGMTLTDIAKRWGVSVYAIQCALGTRGSK